MGFLAKVKSSLQKGAEKVFNFTNSMDWFVTFPRVWQDISDAEARPVDDVNAEIPEHTSHYDTTMQADMARESMGGITAAFILFAMIRDLYRSRHRRYLASEEYLKKRLTDSGLNDNHLEIVLADLPATLFTLSGNKYRLDEDAREKGHLVFKYSPNAEAVKRKARARAIEQKAQEQKWLVEIEEEKQQKRREKDRAIPEPLHKINIFFSRAAPQAISYVYDRLFDSSIYFWVVWAVIGLVLGLSAAATGPFALLIVLSGVVPFGIYMLWKIGTLIHEKVSQSKNAGVENAVELQRFGAPDAADELVPREEDAMIANASELTPSADKTKKYLTRFFIRHDLAQAASALAKERMTFEQAFTSYLNLSVTARREHVGPIQPEDSIVRMRRENLIKTRFVGSAARNRGELFVNVFFGVSTAFLSVAFITWLAYYVLTYAGFVAVGAVVGGPLVLLVGAVVLGVVFAITAYTRTLAAQRDFAIAAEHKLEKQYKNELEAEVDFKEKSRLTKMAELEYQTETEKGSLQKVVGELKAAVSNSNLTADKREDLLAKIDALYKKTLDVVNRADKDDYFEKWRHTIPVFTWAKKIFNRFYAGLGSSQSGVFIGRALFFVTTAGILTLVFGLTIPFGVAVAGIVILAVTFAVLAIVRFQLSRDKEHAENALKDVDARIEYREEGLHALTHLKETFLAQKEQLEPGRVDDRDEAVEHHYKSVLQPASGIRLPPTEADVQAQHPVLPTPSGSPSSDSSSSARTSSGSDSDSDEIDVLLPKATNS